jgi:hypothetical protein
MQDFKHLLAAAAVLGACIVATTKSAEAQEYLSGSCGPPPPTAIYIYPSANWEPFFRRHYYRYGPIVVCSPSVATTSVISVKY